MEVSKFQAVSRAILFTGFAVGISTTSASGLTCQDALSSLTASYQHPAPMALFSAIDGLRGESDCNEETVSLALRQSAGVIASRAQESLDGGDTQGALDLLKKAPAVHWAVQAIRGDIAAKQQDFGEASQLYSAALDTITDPALTKQSDQLGPIVQQIAKLAQENTMLAGTLEATISRGGTPKGVLKLATRGIKIEAVPVQQSTTVAQNSYQVAAVETYIQTYQVETVYLPIKFAFDSDKIDSAGQFEAEKIAAFLMSSHAASAVLEGHSDDVGDATYNLDLSLRRANALRDFLLHRGVQTHIETIGRGETMPPQYSDPSIYDIEQRRTIARRVELILGR